MLGCKEKVPGIASHSNRQRLGRRKPVVPPCMWRDVHRMWWVVPRVLAGMPMPFIHPSDD